MTARAVTSGAIALFLLGVVLLPGPAAAQTGADPVMRVLKELGIGELPVAVSTSRPVAKHLETLTRERCDREAVLAFAEGLKQAGYRREGAQALVRFSENCGGFIDALRRAANILMDLSDWGGAAAVASKIVEEQPHSDNGYYLRATANDKAGKANEAIDDYLTAIALFADKERISSVGYFAASRAYEKLGQYCDAIVPIEAWIALNPLRNDNRNPLRNDNSRTQAVIGTLRSKGQCAEKAFATDETIPITRSGQVVTVSATINGTKGTFIIDTGATFVSLRQSFADRARIVVDPTSKVRLHTANGIIEARRGRAALIELKRVQATEVPVVVQSDASGSYGVRVDGLLGMSFLSRFDVTIDRRSVRLRSRGGVKL
ncbi:aspartyl protease family protein [Bosea sp. LjRoot90]|uniref:retroviral-like aspartic protease family protein n=1 Tax=Bosea sp. LjRoot90 TaxID=3342342 RepID=UPI003ED07D70